MSKKRILSIILTIAMIISVLAFAGCGSKGGGEAEDPKPTNAEELIEYSKKAMKDVDNYSLAGKGSAEIKAAMSGTEMTIPASFDATGEVSKDVIHAKANASIEAMGQKQEVAPEVYMDVKNKKIYSKTEEAADWSSSDLELNADEIKVEIPESLKPELEFSEEDDAYVLTCDLSKIDIKKLIEETIKQQEGTDQDTLEQAMSALEEVDISLDSGTFKVEYDKDTYYVKSVSVKEFAGSGKTEYMEGQSMDITASMELDFTFSDYNKVAADKFELPEVAGE